MPAAFLCLIGALLIALAWQQRAGIGLNADLLKLLPGTAPDAVQQAAERQREQAFTGDLLLLVGAPTEAQAEAAALALVPVLDGSGLFDRIDARQDADWQAIGAALAALRQPLVSAALRERVQSAEGLAGLIEERASALFGPFGGAELLPASADPYGLGADLARRLQPSSRLQLAPESGLLIARAEERSWAIIRAHARAGAFTSDGPARVAALVGELKGSWARGHDVEVLAAGAILYAAAAGTQARQEVATFGSVSLLATVLLLVWVFRSARSLLAVVPICTGALAGQVATGAVFGEVHALTLVFGSSLMGVAIDYALHYLVDAVGRRGAWDPWEAMIKTRPALTLGMATSVIGYLALGLAPFPALKQVAVFSAAGLLVAYATVICLLPALLRGFAVPRQPALLVPLGDALLGLRQRLRGGPAWLVLAGLVILLAPGLALLRTEDDVRVLQTPPPGLRAEEARARAITGINPASQFFIVTAPSADALLLRERELARALDVLVERGALGSYRAISSILPDAATQRANLAVLGARLHGPAAMALWRELGIDPALLAGDRAALAAAPVIDAGTLLASAVGRGYRDLWLGATAGQHASIVQLNGLRDVAAVAACAAGAADIRFVDRVGAVSALMRDTRRLAALLTAGAIVLMALLLALRYGIGASARLLLAPVGGILGALAIGGYLGSPLNLFGVCGLIMVVAIGVDYAIFFKEAASEPSNTMLGVLLDALTTVLSFGMLVFSATPAVAAFGTSVLLGIVLCFLFAPWAGQFASARPCAA